VCTRIITGTLNSVITITITTIITTTATLKVTRATRAASVIITSAIITMAAAADTVITLIRTGSLTRIRISNFFKSKVKSDNLKAFYNIAFFSSYPLLVFDF